MNRYACIAGIRVGMLALPAALLAAALPARPSAAQQTSTAPAVDIRLGPDGLEAVRVAGADLLADGKVTVTAVRLTDRYRDKNQEPGDKQLEVPPGQNPYAGDDRTFRDGDVEPDSRKLDPVKHALLQTYDWGSLTVGYTPGPDRLDIVVEVANRSQDVIEQLSLDLLTLKLAGQVKPQVVSSEPDWARADANIGEPLIVRADHDGGVVVLASVEPGGPLVYRFRPAGRGELAVSLTAGDSGGDGEVYDGLWNVRPIRPGGTDRYELSVRFADKGADVLSMTADAAAAFAGRHPFILRWADRRPIAAIHVGDGQLTPANPRGWKHAVPIPQDWDVHKDEGYKQFREAAIRGADNIIQVARTAGLQGVIVWQIEGQEFGSCAYYGEPRLLPYVAPEMDAAADEFFARLRRAGLRAGICIRPQIFAPFDKEGNRVAWKDLQVLKAFNWTHPKSSKDVFDDRFDTFLAPQEGQSTLALLDAKIRYAKKRWGCSLFYVDTNHFYRPRDRSKDKWAWSGKMMPSEVFEELCRRHSDVLIVPEHEYLQYWSASAPYRQPPQWGGITPAEVRNVYPAAFSLLSADPASEHVVDNYDRYVQAVVDGDIFLSNGWYGGSQTAKLYRQAAGRAPLRVTIAAGGKLTVQTQRDGAPEDNGVSPAGPDALRQVLAERLKGASTVAARRVWIVYEPQVEPEAISAVVQAVAQADGIIAWSSPAGD